MESLFKYTVLLELELWGAAYESNNSDDHTNINIGIYKKEMENLISNEVIRIKFSS